MTRGLQMRLIAVKEVNLDNCNPTTQASATPIIVAGINEHIANFFIIKRMSRRIEYLQVCLVHINNTKGIK